MRKIMKNKRIWSVIGAVLLVIAGVSFLGGARADEVVAPAPTPVRTVEVEMREFREEVSSSGFVRGVRQADIASKTAGYVVDLRVEEGDAVHAGQVIAVLDGAELSAARTQALLSLEAARKTLAETKEYYDQKVDEAEASREKVEDQYDDGEVSRNDRNIAREAEQSAEKLRYAEIAAAEAAVSAAEGAAFVSETALSQATVTAPFAGVVVSRLTSIGSFVSPGMPIYTIASPDELEIRVTIPGAFADTVSVGAPARVLPEAGAEVAGEVFSVAHAVGEATRQTVVRIRLSGDSVSLPLIGAYAEVSILTGEPTEGVAIPTTAVIERYDDHFVFVEEDGVAVKRRVELGEMTEESVEVKSGIGLGERVIVEGQDHLRDGDAVSE
jgi:RND family efflux transporter MFP subunit